MRFDVGRQRRRRGRRRAETRRSVRRNSVAMEQPLISDRAECDRERDAQHREYADLRRRRRRRQVAPVVVFNIDVLLRRRRRRRTEIVKCVDRPLLVNALVGRRRRKICEPLRPKIRRRLKLGRKHGEAAACVGNVRALRVDVQICPVRPRRIGADSPAPIGGFPPDGENGAHPSRLIRLRIGREELAIALDGVALERGRIGVRGRQTG